jgi:ATP-dependent Clp protease ATP-binding subunit ClpA
VISVASEAYPRAVAERARFSLDLEGTRALDAARAIARRHRHPTVELEHLVRVLVDVPAASLAFRERAVDVQALRDRIDARLAEWPPTSGIYRDPNSREALASSFDAVFWRAGATGWFAKLRPVKILPFARAACEVRAIAALLFEARAEIETPRQAVEQASTLARSRGHLTATVLHVLRAIIGQPWLDTILQNARIDVPTLVVALDRRLDDRAARNRDEVADFFFPAPATRHQLVTALLLMPGVDRFLRANRVSVPDILEALVRSG